MPLPIYQLSALDWLPGDSIRYTALEAVRLRGKSVAASRTETGYSREKGTVRLKQNSIPWIKNCLTKAHTYCCSAWIQTPSCLCEGAPAAPWARPDVKQRFVSQRQTDISHVSVCKQARLKASNPSVALLLLTFISSFVTTLDSIKETNKRQLFYLHWSN